MMTDAKDIKIGQKENLQMQLFALTDAPAPSQNSLDQYSNSIVEIDQAPRFYRGQNRAMKITEVKGNEKVIREHEYSVKDVELVCTIKPAIILRKIDNATDNYFIYPGDREELVERVLFLIGAQKGLIKRALPGSPARYGIEFSLYEIHSELKRIKKSKNYGEIYESLQVIRDSNTNISQIIGGKRKSINKDVFTTMYLEESGSGRGRGKCFVALSDDTVNQIYKMKYQQYSLSSVLSHSLTLSRFIHSYLYFNWKWIYTGAVFQLHTRAIMTSFGKGELTIEPMRRDMRKALNGLVKAKLIEAVPNAIDNTYHIVATERLFKEIHLSMQKSSGLGILSGKIEKGEINALPNKRDFALKHFKTA